MYWTIRVVTDMVGRSYVLHVFTHTHTWLRLFFICGQPDGIFWPFHCFYDRALLSASSHISKKRGIRDKEWRWTALYTFLALYTICYTSPLLNCYTQYSYHSLWVFIKICLTINAVLVQNNCFQSSRQYGPSSLLEETINILIWHIVSHLGKISF